MTPRETAANKPAELSFDLPTLQPAPNRRPDSGWIMTVPVLSTAHLPMPVFDLLEGIPQAGHTGTINGIGALLAIEQEGDQDPSGSPELDALLLYVARKGYSYLRLDPDGEVIGDLPQFDW